MKNKFRRCLVLLTLLVCTVMVCATGAQAYTTDEDGNQIVVITIDPGHGGMDGGTASYYGGRLMTERDLCWKISNYCKEILEESYWNVEVHLTRGESDNPSLLERAQLAVDTNSDFMVSIQLNAGGGSARGAYALVPSGNYRPDTAQVAKDVGNSILSQLSALGITNRGTYVRYYPGVTYPDGSQADYFSMIRSGIKNGIPTIIMEEAFLDSYSDYTNFLSTDGKLKQIAAANAAGIAQVLGLEDMSQKPEPRVTSAANGDTPFTDVYEDSWYYDDVTYAYENHLMNGTGDTTFAPDVATTRAMIATLLYRLDNGQADATETHFTDVTTGDWFYQAVEWAAREEITLGYGDGSFLPNQSVTREQLVTFLYRYAQYKGYDTAQRVSLEEYRDCDSISDYAREAMEWAVAVGLVNGVGDQLLNPQGETPRCQVAALFHRYVEKVVGTKAPEPEIPASDESAPEASEPEETEPEEAKLEESELEETEPVEIPAE